MDAVEAPPDARDAADAPDAPPPELTLEVLDTTPCTNWVATDEIARGLPSERTPRQLWYWSPQTDPALGDLDVELTSSSLSGISAVGIDGRTHVVSGTFQNRVIIVGRSGSAERVDGGQAAELADVAVLPDGTALVNVAGHSPRLLSRTADDLTSYDPGGPARFLVGPGGRVYFLRAGTITATCGGVRALWRLRIPTAATSVSIVRQDGSLEVAAGAPFVVAPDGAVDRSPAAYEGFDTVEGFELADDRRLIFGSGPGRASGYYYRAGTSAPVLAPRMDEWTYVAHVLDATGHVWYRLTRTFTDQATVRWRESELWSMPSSMIFPSHALFGEDGSIITMLPRASGVPVVQRVAPDGAVLWQIVPQDQNGEPVDMLSTSGMNMSLGESGILTISAATGVAAIQTDVLPPTTEHCTIFGCSGRRDWSAVRVVR